MKTRILFLVALLTFAPIAQASHGEESPGQEIIRWREEIYAAQDLTDWDGDSVIVNLTRPHDRTVLDYHATVIISGGISIDSGTATQTRSFFTSINNNQLPECTLFLQADGTIGNPGIDTVNSGRLCGPHNNTGVDQIQIGVNQTWNFTNTGTADVDFFAGNVYVEVEDVIQRDNMILEFMEQFAAPIFALILVALGRREEFVMGATILNIIAVGVMILATINIWPEIEALRLAFIAFTAYILLHTISLHIAPGSE